MTRDDLIQKAAKAIHAVAEGGAPWGDARMADKDQHRAEARAALAVFEQAHTPTDDEREARKVAEERYPTLRPHPGEAMYPKSALHHYKQGAFIAGWKARRPIQGEPSDAQAWAAAHAFAQAIKNDTGRSVMVNTEHVRAALRAAGVVGQEGESRG